MPPSSTFYSQVRFTSELLPQSLQRRVNPFFRSAPRIDELRRQLHEAPFTIRELLFTRLWPCGPRTPQLHLAPRPGNAICVLVAPVAGYAAVRSLPKQKLERTHPLRELRR